MLKRLAFSGVAALAMLCAACSCPAERKAVDRLDEQQEKLFKKYEAYVSVDPKLDAGAKNDEMGLIRSLRDMMTSLKKSMGD